MREYRTRLVAEVVTGKLDVRARAARLPVEVDEPELIDECDTSEDFDDDVDDIPGEAEA
jgi:type I restriction enzyme S subunit